MSELLKTIFDYNSEKIFFSRKDVSSEDKARRLLFLFQKDLIPGISGKIIEAKDKRDFKKVKEVSLIYKIFGWIFLALIIIGMLFYIFLFAIGQNSSRQSAWVYSFLLWLCIEIFVVSSLLVLFTHIFLPMLAMRDVNKIKKKISEEVWKFQQSNNSDPSSEISNSGLKNPENSTPAEFNAAEYFFISLRVAQDHPELKEARMLKRFKTPWPKQSFQRKHDVSKAYNKKFSAFTRSFAIVLVFLLSSLLGTALTIQDMIIHMVTTSIVGYLILLEIQLYNKSPVLAFLPILVVLILIFSIFRFTRRDAKRKLAKVSAVTSEKDSTQSPPLIEKEIPDSNQLDIIEDTASSGNLVSRNSELYPVGSNMEGSDSDASDLESINNSDRDKAELDEIDSSNEYDFIDDQEADVSMDERILRYKRNHRLSNQTHISRRDSVLHGISTLKKITKQVHSRSAYPSDEYYHVSVDSSSSDSSRSHPSTIDNSLPSYQGTSNFSSSRENVNIIPLPDSSSSSSDEGISSFSSEMSYN